MIIPWVGSSPERGGADADDASSGSSYSGSHASLNMLEHEMENDEEDDVDALLAQVDAQITRTWNQGGGPRSRSVPLDVASPEVERLARRLARRRQYGILALLTAVGLVNKVLSKLVTLPMANYPNALNLLTTAVYVPLSYAYILPVARHKPEWITAAHRRLPCAPFATMGALDAAAATLQVFATTALPGPLVVLLLQFAIPVSMGLSRQILQARFTLDQAAGALATAVGVAVAIGPDVFAGGRSEGDPASRKGQQVLWGFLLLVSTIPMCLSSIYKEIRLKDHDLDAVFLNDRIAAFQLLFALPLALPLAAASSPPVEPDELPKNLVDGFKCALAGVDAVRTCAADDDDDDAACVLDDCWPRAPAYVAAYVFFNVAYNILIILTLKVGDANLLWLAMTLLVPLSTFAFSLPFVPDHAPPKPTDAAALCIISLGIALYRFGTPLWLKRRFCRKGLQLGADDDDRSAALLPNDSAEFF